MSASVGPQSSMERKSQLQTQYSTTVVESISMNLSVIVPVFNEEATVVQLLESVASAPLPEDIDRLEIISVDDRSADGTFSVLKLSLIHI